MSEDLVARARRLVAGATASNPLPWRQCCDGANPACWHMVWADGEQEMTICGVTRHEFEPGDHYEHRSPEDAKILGAFFAAAPTLISDLCDEVGFQLARAESFQDLVVAKTREVDELKAEVDRLRGPVLQADVERVMQLTSERDAAIRERDKARAEVVELCWQLNEARDDSNLMSEIYVRWARKNDQALRLLRECREWMRFDAEDIQDPSIFDRIDEVLDEPAEETNDG